MAETSPTPIAPPRSWERQPARVTFLPKVGDKLSVTVRGRFVDEVADDDSDEP